MSSSSRAHFRIKKISEAGIAGNDDSSLGGSNSDTNLSSSSNLRLLEGEGKGGESPGLSTKDGEDFYEEMSGLGGTVKEADEDSDLDDGAYTFMFHGKPTETATASSKDSEKEILQSEAMKRAIQLSLSVSSIETSPVKLPHKESIIIGGSLNERTVIKEEEEKEEEDNSVDVCQRDPAVYVDLEANGITTSGKGDA